MSDAQVVALIASQMRDEFPEDAAVALAVEYLVRAKAAWREHEMKLAHSHDGTVPTGSGSWTCGLCGQVNEYNWKICRECLGMGPCLDDRL